MTLFDELVHVVRALDAAGIEYGLVGGLAVDIQNLEEQDR